MASKFSKVLVGILTREFEKVGEIAVVELLQDFHDKDPEKYAKCIQNGHAFAQPLIDFVRTTKTHVDDSIVDLLHNAVDESAKANGIELIEPE